VYSDAQAWGGAEAVAAGLVGVLSESYAVTVLGVDRAVVSRLAQDLPDVRQEVLRPVRGKRDLGGAAAHAQALRRLRPHVVLVNLQVPWAGQYAQAAALALRLPVVAVEHAPLPTSSGAQRAAKRLTSARLAAHLSVSAAAAREVERVAGLPSGSVRVVRNGLPPTTTAPAAVPDGLTRPLVVAAGRLDVVKGFDVLLSALPDVPGASLWLLGEGEERAPLERLVQQLGLADRVRLAGWHDDPRSAFAAADVVVVPSRWESSPLVAAEALQAGAALVVSDVGGLPEVVGDAAVLVPPEDAPALAAALRGLLADPAERSALQGRARAAALALPDLQQVAAGYDAVLREVLGRSHQDS
jgi:glycosyltransferase involved in cell wall biosynthesis